ncbi:MAG: hypothetical protein ABSE62_01255 [Chthoniobacteraceae bacterium]|jgi:DNA-binding transcriptional regulator GbsR (MarR family)
MNEQLVTIDKPEPRVEKLTRIEADIIDIFVRMARFFGVSKSVAEIYGLLFISTSPVPLDYIRSKLNLSSGSASQGLRLLRTVGAVHATYVAGDRRDHYLAETGLRKITSGFLREKVASDLMVHEDQLQRLSALLDDMPSSSRPHIEERINILERWRRQARAVLPILMSGLETES